MINQQFTRNTQMPKYNCRSLKDFTVQFEYENPKDSQQSIKWANLNSNNAISELFCCGGWDGYLRIYRIKCEFGSEQLQNNRSIDNQVNF